MTLKPLVSVSKVSVKTSLLWHLISFFCKLARDSYKDEIIVRSFLIITIGLILYTLIKPFIEDWQKVNLLNDCIMRIINIHYKNL
jgi:hypothetical protein